MTRSLLPHGRRRGGRMFGAAVLCGGGGHQALRATAQTSATQLWSPFLACRHVVDTPLGESHSCSEKSSPPNNDRGCILGDGKNC